MDLDKVYFDLEGNECNILEMVNLFPEWAANRIQVGETLLTRNKELEERQKWIDEVGRPTHPDDERPCCAVEVIGNIYENPELGDGVVL